MGKTYDIRLHEARNAIACHNIISFDIFDTLLIRPVLRPEHLFELIAYDARKILGDDFFPFAEQRMEAELSARQGKEEITLHAIYDQLHRLWPGLSQESLSEVKALELRTEMVVARPNPLIQPLYLEALEQGKTIIYTSDMYLPSETIRVMLAKAGYHPDYKLFLSSELGVTKWSGRLFEHILNTLGIKAHALLHIGDNKHADVIMAKKYGIDSYHLPKLSDLLLKHPRGRSIWKKPLTHPHGMSPLLSLMAGTMVADIAAKQPELLFSKRSLLSESWDSFGYQVAGPLFLGFTMWLQREVKAYQPDLLCFLSRDGKIIKRIYELLSPEDSGSTRYVLASRRCLNIARITKLDALALEYLTGSPEPMTFRQFIERLDLEPANQDAVFKELSIDPDRMVRSAYDMQKLRALFFKLEYLILEKATKEREALLHYYKQIGFLDSAKPIIVDIGWHGRLLYAINSQRDASKIPARGCYVGTHASVKETLEAGHVIDGFLFNQAEPKEFHTMLMECIEIVELMFSSKEGSLQHVTTDSNGELRFIFDESETTTERVKAVEKLQEAAIRFIQDMKTVLDVFPHLRLDQRASVMVLEAFLSKPTKQEATMFDGILHHQHFGDKKLARVFVPKPSIPALIVKPLAVANQYKSAYWRKGYLTLFPIVFRGYFYVLAYGYTWGKQGIGYIKTLFRKVRQGISYATRY